MKKAGVLLFLISVSIFLLISTQFVSAQNSTEQQVDKAYSCLEGKVKNKCSSLTLEEQAFSLLALASSDVRSECETALTDNSKNNGECWPKSACKLRETALSVLALNNVNKNTDDAEDWLLSQNATPTDLIWFLEIDSNSATTCTITYDSKSYTVNIGENKKIDKSAGSCLTLAQDDYWLQISSSCINKKFTVSCDKGFLSALLYKKTNSDVVYVSSQTSSASASGTTEHQVNAYCFKQGNSCNYEGSLWAALALQKTNHDISSFTPYLIALAPNNEKFSPYSFLYILTAFDEYFSIITNSQNPAGYWDFSSSYNKFYDTAAVLLSLQGAQAEQSEKAKQWLLENQQESGCWNNNNIRDTSFMLYAAWNKPFTGGGGVSIDKCTDYGFFCISPGECTDVGGKQLENYNCEGVKICCDKKPAELTCSDKGGKICRSDETCDGDVVSASDTSECCTGTCKTVEVPECENQGYTCKNSCSDTEETKSYECQGSKICCGAKTPTTSYWWIWVLAILIILVIIGIIFRNKLRVMLFKIKSGFKKGPAPRETRPPFPPMLPPRPGPRFVLPQPSRQVQKPAAKSKLDTELEETLKKLKEMGK